MDINEILDGKISVEGQTLPTVREIIDTHFITTAGGNAALGKMVSAQYVTYLTNMANPPRQETKTETAGKDEPTPKTGTERAASGAGASGFRVSPDVEAILKSMGVPLSGDGRVDVIGALSGAMTAEGSKTPLGTLMGAVMRNIGEASKPRT